MAKAERDSSAFLSRFGDNQLCLPHNLLELDLMKYRSELGARNRKKNTTVYSKYLVWHQ